MVIAMGLAGLVNMAMLYMATATFHVHGLSNVADINSAYQTLTPLLGGAASLVFAISLLASGLSSSTVLDLCPALWLVAAQLSRNECASTVCQRLLMCSL